IVIQAEDGIRALHVTGVQTCALPISSWIETNKWLLSIRLKTNRLPMDKNCWIALPYKLSAKDIEAQNFRSKKKEQSLLTLYATNCMWMKKQRQSNSVYTSLHQNSFSVIKL